MVMKMTMTSSTTPFKAIGLAQACSTWRLSTDHRLRPCQALAILAVGTLAGAGKFVGSKAPFVCLHPVIRCNEKLSGVPFEAPTRVAAHIFHNDEAKLNDPLFLHMLH
mmetsp:Transcript_106676/g.267383  ORF Transcript_106676/g.267383 Transcript_106676/m.267383 type:complete len:108 (+) Transcript_106676:1928-2251(+)